MPRSFCDHVIMSASREVFHRRDDDALEILTHLDHCAACREAVSRKIAVQQLILEVGMDPIAARRLAVRVLAKEKSTAGIGHWWLRAAWTASGGFVVLLMLSVFSPLFQGVRAHPDSSRTVEPSITRESAASAVEQAELSAIRLKSRTTAKTFNVRQGAAVWMQRGTEVDLIADTMTLARARIIRGRIIVDISRRTPGFQFVVNTPTAEVLSLGTVFSVEVADDGRETIRVAKSAVVVRPKGERDPIVVRAGEELVLGGADTKRADEADVEGDLCLVRGNCPGDSDDIDTEISSTPISPAKKDVRRLRYRSVEEEPTMGERVDAAFWEGNLEEAETLLFHWENPWGDEQLRRMIKLATRYRNNRKFKRAVDVYERLYSMYPDRDAAINGLVSMAQIKQSFLGDPAGAVHYFDRYMRKRPRGILAEAAAAGKVRALYGMQHWQEVVEASKQYMQLYSGGPSEREILHKRRQALEKLGRMTP